MYIKKKKKKNIQAVSEGISGIAAAPYCNWALQKECQEYFSRLKEFIISIKSHNYQEPPSLMAQRS